MHDSDSFCQRESACERERVIKKVCQRKQGVGERERETEISQSDPVSE